MPLPLSLPITGGVDIMRTPLQVGRGIVNSNLIRFRNGSVQKLGGCSRLTSLTFIGQARGLFAWQDLTGLHYIAVGTNQLIEVFAAGVYTVIMPLAHTSSSLSTPFATVANSAVVTVTDAGYSPAVGSWINIVNLIYVNGLLLQGIYQVVSSSGTTYTFNAASAANATGSGGATLAFTTVNTQSAVTITLGAYVFANNQSITVGVSTAVGGLTLLGSYTVAVTAGPIFTITANGNATSGATVSENGGDAEIQYYTSLPLESGAPGGYGLGPYGQGPYGYGSAASGSSPLLGSQPGVLFLNEWSMDRWGQNLVFCWVGSTVYQWVPPVAPGNVGAAVSGAPQAVTGLFVAAPQQQTMAWGAYSATLGEQDPLLVAWCDVGDLTDWTTSATNQAGSFRLSSGNLIIGGTWFGTAGLFWTDIDLWAMVYVGFPLVYGFSKIGTNCGLIARRAWATMGTLCVWMSQRGFFVYQGGSVSPLPCTVFDFVFNSIDIANLEAMHADSNTYNGEVTWWFPQIGSNGVCTGAVKWHAVGGEWDITQSGLAISAWTDQSVLGPPIGAFYNGLLEQFETAIDFDGQILDSYFVSGFFQIAEAEDVLFVERVYPDFVLSSSAVIAMTFYFADDMASAANPALVRTYGPFTVTAQTSYIIVRGRGRVMQFRVDCNVALNSFYRYGESPMTAQIDGRK